MGPQEPVPSFQSKDCMPVTRPEAQHEDLGKGAGWVQRKGPGVSFQEESMTEIQGRARSRGTGSRNRAQAEWKGRGGDRAESFLGRGPWEDTPPSSGLQSKRAFDGLLQRNSWRSSGEAFPD